VLANQGVPAGAFVSKQVEQVFTEANETILLTAHPKGILATVRADDFSRVYNGKGLNELRTPVGDIYEEADHLALFAVTIGPQPGVEIARRFESHDFALACMLDAAASVAAENTADVLEQRFEETLLSHGWDTPHGGVLRYSPGYCGWHISGQRALFDHLHPEQIGLTLRESFLMEPLKSISGVVIAGPREIHNFPIDYDFCDQCETRNCRQRLRALYADQERRQ
jgi:hypothetical protein